MNRYWVHRSADGEEVVGTYFDGPGKAQAVADALEQEAGQEYEVR